MCAEFITPEGREMMLRNAPLTAEYRAALSNHEIPSGMGDLSRIRPTWRDIDCLLDALSAAEEHQDLVATWAAAQAKRANTAEEERDRLARVLQETRSALAAALAGEREP